MDSRIGPRNPEPTSQIHPVGVNFGKQILSEMGQMD